MNPLPKALPVGSDRSPSRPLAALAGAFALAVVAGLAAGGCQPTLGQTAVVITVTTEAPIDCVTVSAVAPGGTPVEQTTGKLAPKALDEFRAFGFKVLVYAGDKLGDGQIDVTATGHRGGCEGEKVAEGKHTYVFSRGVVGEIAVVLKLVGQDADGDGYADELDCGPHDPLVFPRAAREGQSPNSRECDGIDNNCDDTVDEGCGCTAPKPCHPLGLSDPRAGAGECRLGTQACEGGVLGACTGAVLPTTERCDGKDNDCDGQLDLPSCPCTEGEKRDCYSVGPANAAGRGICLTGKQTCTGGFFGPCVGDVAPSAERCNAKDDDCDGIVDNADRVDVGLCDKQEGVCAGARRTCTGGEAATSCATADYDKSARARGLVFEANETLCDGVDNDCDGEVDDGCDCSKRGTTEVCFPLGPTRPEGVQGTCRRGTRKCGADLKWGPCEGAIGPVAETCNGKDDDCDGTTDDGVPDSGQSCDTGRPGSCRPGELRCNGVDLVCVSRSPAVDEVCDGVDNDCDGSVDDGYDKLNDESHCGGPNDCTACTSGDTCCGGRCTDTTSDADNCGDCGRGCELGAACCGSACHDLTSDPANCGRCGEACTGGRVCRQSACVPPTETTCADGLDDDRDGHADCEDPDCAEGVTCEFGAGDQVVRVCRSSRCVPKNEARCDDLLDNDLDGLADCEDPDCVVGAACGSVGGFQKVCRTPTAIAGSPAPLGRCVFAAERDCSDADDNDLDGRIDCADSDCTPGTRCDDRGGVCHAQACTHEDSCTNRTDDDGDNKIDCEDTADCAEGVPCDAQGGACSQGQCRRETGAQCADGVDNNANGLSDCADDGCAAGTACGGGGTCCVVQGQRACAKEYACTDGEDNDCDGKVDCQDTGDCGCTAGSTCCGSTCANLATDLNNCRSCGHKCDDANPCTTESCGATDCVYTKVADRTQAGTCNGARLCCNGTCVSGTESGATCTDGVDNDCDGKVDCQDPDCGCQNGAACCGSACRDLTSDVDNCNTCGNKCTTTNSCQTPACVAGGCTTLSKADRSDCGSGNVCCGGSCVGGHETQCDDGRDNDCDGLIDCQDTSDCPSATKTFCAGAGRCLDLSTDLANCGTCGRACAAGEFCLTGRCLRETTGDTSPSSQCGDNSDNDGDGLKDCADPDCTDGSKCANLKVCCGGTCKAEACGNGVDDDCDGLADCADPDCAAQACGDGLVCVSGVCSCTPTSCGTGCCAGSGTTCVRYLTQTATQCGTDGLACVTCGGATPVCSQSNASCIPNLVITPPSVTLAVGNSRQFTASGGGGAPYTFTIASGGGTISAGNYTAPNTAGPATVRVTDALGFSRTASVVINPALAISPATVTLAVGNTRTFTESGGVGPYTYSVVTGGGSFSGSTYTAPATAGSATVRVTDSLGNTSNATVTVNPALAISPAVVTLAVNNTRVFTATGGVGPYSFSKASGVGTVSVATYTAPAAPGAAVVRVTDSLGNTSDAAVTVNAALVISPTPVVLAAGNTQVFSATGGVTPYTYVLQSGVGTVSAAGTYTAPATSGVAVVRVQDAVGNTSDASVTVNGALAISPATALLAVTNTQAFSATGGVGPYVYSLFSGTGSVSGSTYTAPAAAGSAVVRVTDSLGNTSSATVTVNAALAISPSPLTLAVLNTQLFTASGGVPPYTYSKESGSGTLTGASYTAGASAGAAVIRVTDARSNTSDCAVTVNAALAISPTTFTLAAGATKLFSATGGVPPYTYSVPVGGGSMSGATYTAPASAGSATVRVTDSRGNTKDSAVTINGALAISPATVDLGPGNSKTFTASGGVGSYTFSILTGGGSLSGATYTAPGSAGAATVRVTDSSGNTADAAITINAALTISPSTVVLGPNNTQVFAAAGGVPPYTYNRLSGIGSMMNANTYLAPAGAGSATVRVTDALLNTADATITINAALAISPASVTVAVNTTQVFTASGGVAPYTFSKFSGSGSVATATYSAPATPGSAVVRVTDSLGNTSDSAVTVSAALTISPSTWTLAVTNTKAFSASGGAAPYTYSLQSGTGSVSGNTYTAPASAGSAVVRVTDAQGSTSDATITVNAALAISPAAVTLAVGNSRQFAATGGVAPYTYSKPSGVGTLTVDTYQAPASAGSAVVRVTDAVGNTSDSAVTVNAALAISPAPVTLAVGNTQVFSATGGVPPYAYTKESGTGTLTGASYTAPGSAGSAVVRVTDSLNNTSDAAITVNAALAISPATWVLAVQNTKEFTATGGVPPYTFTKDSGTGSVSGAIYTAPASSGSAVVRVSDTRNNTSDAAVTVNPALAISPASQSVAVNGTINFSATGGVGPYAFSIFAGNGSIASGTYTAPAAAGSATVRATDARGNTSDCVVTITP